MSQSLPAFTAPGRFWRGNLHTHSTRSDGVLEPEEVCRRYRAEGYDFLALTDHFVGRYGYPIVDTLPFRTNSFTTILGAELHSGAMANGELWHILAVGLPADFGPSHSPDFFPVDGQESGAELAARAVAAGAFVAVAHPQWSGLTLADARGITAAHAVEIYNHGCAEGCDRADGFAIADLLLSEGRRLSLVAPLHLALPRVHLPLTLWGISRRSTSLPSSHQSLACLIAGSSASFTLAAAAANSA